MVASDHVGHHIGNRLTYDSVFRDPEYLTSVLVAILENSNRLLILVGEDGKANIADVISAAKEAHGFPLHVFDYHERLQVLDHLVVGHVIVQEVLIECCIGEVLVQVLNQALLLKLHSELPDLPHSLAHLQA